MDKVDELIETMAEDIKIKAEQQSGHRYDMNTLAENTKALAMLIFARTLQTQNIHKRENSNDSKSGSEFY